MNNNIKKLMVFFIISLFLLMPVAFADNGDYTIPEANVHVDITDDGTAIITENITKSS